jgi:hypothetical protein
MELQNLRFVSLTNEEEGSFKGVTGEFVIRTTDALDALSSTDPAFLEAVQRQMLSLLQEHLSLISPPQTPERSTS